MKTVKSLLLGAAVLISSFTFSAKAQEHPLNIGMSIGTSIHNATGPKKSKLRWGYDLAFTVDYGLSNAFYLQSALEFKNKGFWRRHMPDTERGSSKFYVNQLYLQIPIYAAYKLDIAPGKRWFVNAGPYVALGVGGKMKFEHKEGGWDRRREKSTFSKEGLKRFEVGLGFGTGFELSGLVIHLNYELGLNNVSRRMTVPSKVKNRNFVASIGFKM